MGWRFGVTGPGIIIGRKGTVDRFYWEAGNFFAIDTVFYVVPKDDVPLNFAWYLPLTLGLEGMNTDAAVPGSVQGKMAAIRKRKPSQNPRLFASPADVGRSLHGRMHEVA